MTFRRKQNAILKTNTKITEFELLYIILLLYKCYVKIKYNDYFTQWIRI